MNFQRVLEIVATFEIDPFLSDDELYGSLKFRIEIAWDRQANLFFPKVYRWETFRVQPTFPQQEGTPIGDLADYEILVKDCGIDCHEIVGHSVQDTLDKVLQQLKIIFLES
jgi:hypothetical protein